MDIRANRRNIVSAGVALAAAATVRPSFLFAQDATPDHTGHDEGPSASRPAPELLFEVTDDGIFVPSEVAAGLNRVTVTNSSSSDFNLLVFTLPEEATIEEVIAVLADEEAPVPEWLLESWLPGNPNSSAPGESVTGYAFYHPGSYVAANIFGGQIGEFVVSGDPWGVPAPQSDLRVGMVEMTFLGIEGPIAAGPQTWEVVNHGATFHETVLLATPELWTPDEVLEMLTSESEEIPEGVAFLPGTGIASPGSTVWVDLDLGVGAYAAVCFAPDNFSGPPHAFLGMISTFEVV